MTPIGSTVTSCPRNSGLQSELGMLRKLWDIFLPGDVVLADRSMCTWTEMVMLKQRGVDRVFCGGE